MKTLILFVTTLSLFFLAGCTSDSGVEPTPEKLVVQAYLYANEPIEDIRLTLMLPLDVEEGTPATPVNDAQVTLLKDDSSYQLQKSPGDSGYYHLPGNNLPVQAGDHFDLQIEYQNQLITAETVVPEAPTGVTISTTTVKVPDMEDIVWGEGSIQDLMISLTWENESGDLYYVTIKCLEENPVEIDSEMKGRMRQRVFPPTRRNEFNVNPMLFDYYGKHLLKLYRVNQEYADLYDTQTQDSRDLNEPLTNIENGLGVFSAFHANVDSLILNVVTD